MYFAIVASCFATVHGAFTLVTNYAANAVADSVLLLPPQKPYQLNPHLAGFLGVSVPTKLGQFGAHVSPYGGPEPHPKTHPRELNQRSRYLKARGLSDQYQHSGDGPGSHDIKDPPSLQMPPSNLGPALPFAWAQPWYKQPGYEEEAQAAKLPDGTTFTARTDWKQMIVEGKRRVHMYVKNDHAALHYLVDHEGSDYAPAHYAANHPHKTNAGPDREVYDYPADEYLHDHHRADLGANHYAAALAGPDDTKGRRAPAHYPADHHSSGDGRYSAPELGSYLADHHAADYAAKHYEANHPASDHKVNLPKAGQTADDYLIHHHLRSLHEPKETAAHPPHQRAYHPKVAHHVEHFPSMSLYQTKHHYNVDYDSPFGEAADKQAVHRPSDEGWHWTAGDWVPGHEAYHGSEYWKDPAGVRAEYVSSHRQYLAKDYSADDDEDYHHDVYHGAERVAQHFKEHHATNPAGYRAADHADTDWLLLNYGWQRKAGMPDYWIHMTPSEPMKPHDQSHLKKYMSPYYKGPVYEGPEPKPDPGPASEPSPAPTWGHVRCRDKNRKGGVRPECY